MPLSEMSLPWHSMGSPTWPSGWTEQTCRGWCQARRSSRRPFLGGGDGGQFAGRRALQGADQLGTAAPAPLRVGVEGPGDGGAVGGGQALQVGHAPGGSAARSGGGQGAGQQLVVDQGQAVL